LQERGQHGSRPEARRETAGIATVTLNCQAHCTSIPTNAKLVGRHEVQAADITEERIAKKPRIGF
jgi:hypothetical protein